MLSNKSGVGYSLNSEGKKFVFTKEEIKGAMEETNISRAYEFLQVFNKGTLRKYLSISVVGSKSILERMEFIKNNYNIRPSDSVVLSDDEVWIRYTFSGEFPGAEFESRSEVLQELYSGVEIRRCFPFEGERKNYGDVVDNGYLKVITNKLSPKTPVSAINLSEYQKAEQLDIGEVVAKLEIEEATIDPITNIVTTIGKPFEVVSRYLESGNAACEFFNSEFSLKFKTGDELSKEFRVQGIDAVTGDYIEYQPDGYYVPDEAKGVRRITDFGIKVHNSFFNGVEYQHFVTLTNEKAGVVSPKVVYPNCSGKSKFADFLQKQGNFHFFGKDSDVSSLHAMVISQKVPAVRQVKSFGWHHNEGICIFANGIYEKSTKLFTPTNDDSGIYNKPNGDGVIPCDAVGNKVKDVIGNRICYFNESPTDTDPVYFLDSLKGLWKDDTGVVLFMMACLIAGAGYMNIKKDIPIIYIRGITQSGKTTFSEIMHTMCGYPHNSAETFGGTAFTALAFLASVDKLPVFFSEARNKSRGINEKKNYLRSLYDAMPVNKGRADLTVANYTLSSIAFIEGEEIVNDGAVRTRSIQFRPDKNAKLNSPIEFENAKARANKLRYFFESYYKNVDDGMLDLYYKEGYDLMRAKVGGRSLNNLSMLYAMTMCYLPEYKKEYLSSMDKLAALQAKDEEENGTSVDILKSISAFVTKAEYPIYFTGGGFVISWESIKEYATKYRHEFSLDVATYREHLDAMGYDVNFYEVTNGFGDEMLIEGPKFMFDGIDKRLLGNTEIYAGYKQWVASQGVPQMTKG